MTWTTTRPTVPGWYWVRYGGYDRIRDVHAVYQDTPTLRVEAPDGWFEDIINIDGQWAGPIPSPEEAQP